MNSAPHALGVARSWLFVPGDRPERFEKAVTSGADVVVCDLEDAVAPGAKATARTEVRAWLENGGRACVRVNAAGTSAHDGDIGDLADAPGLLAVMIPKAEDSGLLATIAAALPPRVRLIPLIETAVGISHALAIASVPAVARLAFGSLDYALDIDAIHEPDTLLLPRSQLVVASRAASLSGPVDGVTTAIRDPRLTATDARYARSLGMRGKLCVHPSQIAAVNAEFSPSDADIAWAKRVLAASGGEQGAAEVDGHMVDKPVVARAQRVLALGRTPLTVHSGSPAAPSNP